VSPFIGLRRVQRRISPNREVLNHFQSLVVKIPRDCPYGSWLGCSRGFFSSKPDAWRICCYTNSASATACWAVRSFLTDSQSRSAGSITSRPAGCAGRAIHRSAVQNSLEEHGLCFSGNVRSTCFAPNLCSAMASLYLMVVVVVTCE